MPCLDEAEALELCVRKAQASLDALGLPGEVLVADNGSTDGSVEIATRLGARVVHVAAKGYGNALRGGISAARGTWILMADADGSYDFSAIGGFVEKLREGHDLVMGCRLPAGGGEILPGAMPWKNRWIGNPLLSLIGRIFFRSPLNDFHCGMRAFTKDACERMELTTTGMEFASEMVMKARLKNLRVAETPVTLHPDGRSRPPHLRPWRDGWRHLRFMLLYCPRWLFLAPGCLLMLAGLAAMLWLLPGPRRVGGVNFDVHSLLYAAMSVLIGFQAVTFAVFTKVFAISAGLLPPDSRLGRLSRIVTLETGLAVGAALVLAGLASTAWALLAWKHTGFGDLDASRTLRIAIPATMTLVLGAQTILSSFFLSVLGLRRTGSKLG
jgi:glycosyltransferase involved in cell wall biosynthesis